MRTIAFEMLPVSFTPVASGLLQRQCACGGKSTGARECSKCRAKKSGIFQHGFLGDADSEEIRPILHQVLHVPGQSIEARSRAVAAPRIKNDFNQLGARNSNASGAVPYKSLAAVLENSDQEKPPPRQGSASIQCDGSGGYEITYGGWAGTTCGTLACVKAHEGSHMADWRAKWPTGCVGKPQGYLPKGDPPDSPLMTASNYKEFLKQSECKAHTIDLACAEALPKTPACQTTIDNYIKLTQDQKANWCPSLSRGEKIAFGIGGGAAGGAGIGLLAGGPVGAAIGAGVGALAGGILGALL